MKCLPPGQKESDLFPRFGLPQYAQRFPKETQEIRLTIGGDLEDFELSEVLTELPRTTQLSDFHCVTTWSKLELNWSGYKFSDFYNTLILPKVSDEIRFVVLKAQDGYKTSMLLSDLMQADVLLTDQLDYEPLSIAHGAPVRIIAPKHYGYKNIKHLKRIEFYREAQQLKTGIARIMDHPRARVAHEERASIGPGIIYRWLYRLGITGTIKEFDEALIAHEARMKKE